LTLLALMYVACALARWRPLRPPRAPHRTAPRRAGPPPPVQATALGRHPRTRGGSPGAARAGRHWRGGWLLGPASARGRSLPFLCERAPCRAAPMRADPLCPSSAACGWAREAARLRAAGSPLARSTRRGGGGGTGRRGWCSTVTASNSPGRGLEQARRRRLRRAGGRRAEGPRVRGPPLSMGWAARESAREARTPEHDGAHNTARRVRLQASIHAWAFTLLAAPADQRSKRNVRRR
jgi:hypothetical protein